MPPLGKSFLPGSFFILTELIFFNKGPFLVCAKFHIFNERDSATFCKGVV